MDITFEDVYLNAKALHESADHLAAYQAMRPIMEYPGNMHGMDAWNRAWHLFAGIAGALGFEKLSQLSVKCGDNPHDPEVMYHLGYELIEVELPNIAATPLNQAHLMQPDSEAVLTELTTALENAGMYDIAYLNLISTPEVLEKSYICRYLTAFNGIMSGHLDEVRAMRGDLQDVPDPSLAFMRNRINRYLKRADQVEEIEALDTSNLRGWHYVLTGGHLLHLASDGYDSIMKGRYAYLHDSYSLAHTGLNRLSAALRTWGIEVQEVVYYPNRDSEVLATALGQLMKLPVKSWSPDLSTEAPGICVAYDIRDTSTSFLQHCAIRNSEQLLFAHSFCWTEDFPISPDFITFMHQECSRPWAPGISIESDGKVNQLAFPDHTDDIPAITLANRILNSAEIDSNIDAVENFLNFIQSVGKPPTDVRREKYFHGSPVRSHSLF